MSDAHRIALAAARGAAAAVEASRGRLNDLNVYPVPDGDTGSNLADTARELAAGLEASSPDGTAGIAVAAKRAVLMGASGNSGAILSQIVGGFVDVVGSTTVLDSATLARALRSASDAAYRPVQLPIEGTMLTVIRVMAETAEAHPDDALDALIDRVLDAGADCVTRTQSMLAVLREAGVVDAGAAGLVEFCRGAVAGARGEHIHAPIESIARPLSIEAVHQEESRFRYCTSFLVEGDEIERELLERQLRQLGDCLLVVGEAPMCRVHLHTDDPGAALSRAVAMGALDRVSIANMHEQTRQREERLSAAPALVALPGGRAGEAARLTAENTAIVLDSTADAPHPEREHPNWRMVPLIVRFGEEQFDDWVGIEPADLYRRLRAGGPHPRTAAPPPGAYLRMFEQLSAYAHVIVLPVSSKVSGSLQAAQIAADDPAADGRVTVLDGRSVSVGTWMLAEGVQRMLEEGTTLADVTEWVESARERLRIVIYVPTLEFLRRGGRISRVREISGNAIGIRPILTLRDGELGLYRRVRGGRRRALHEFERFLTEQAPGRAVRVGVAHGADPAGAETLVKMVREVRPDAVIERVCEIGAVVGTHGGPGTLGMMVLAEP